MRPEVFPGTVKYSGTDSSTGTVKWKTGSLIIDKDDLNGWKIKLMYACSDTPCLTMPLTSHTLVKKICNDAGVFIDLKRSVGSTTLISLYYRSDQKRHIHVLKDLLTQVERSKPTGTMPKCIVGLSGKENAVNSVNIGRVDSQEKENNAQNFTSVKSHRRDSYEGKENNLSSTKPTEQFLQRSAEKSRKCLSTLSTFYSKTSSNPSHTSTPSRWLNSKSKRTPGLMPDPTPIKRPRLSDSISYSMKVKPVQSAEVNQTQTLQGFSNLGNTCYMNAILQCLFGLETLATDLTSNRKMLKSFQQHSLFHALVKLLYVKRQANATDISKRDALRRVKCAISNTAKRFSGYGQHDAHEFLMQVLDQLKEEVIKVSKATPTPNKENDGGLENRSDSASSTYPGQNPITVNFEFEVLHTITCMQCKDEVTKTEQFHDISLDVPKQKDLLTPRSLQDALMLFFKNEEIDYTCEKCGHCKSNVTHKISRLPRVFILHLKRYSYSQLHSKNTKMGQNVRVPFYLTLQHHCGQETQPPYPPLSVDAGTSEQKLCQSVIEDSKCEETPSRRKLEYTGFGFKKPSPETSTDKSTETESMFTETKQKGDDVDSAITLDYEEDPDLTRAIQMSLKEQEDKNKVLHDYDEDSDSNIEKVLEMSRHEQRTDSPKVKKIQEMTEEEMIQLAIEQSLLDSEPNHHDNITQTDDVINTGDHMYSRNNNGFMDISSNNQESYDIGPDDVDLDSRKMMFNHRKPYVRKRHKSESEIESKLRGNCEETCPKDFDEVSASPKMETVINEDAKFRNKCKNDSSEKVSKTWSKRLHNLSDQFDADCEDNGVDLDLTCEEVLPNDFEVEEKETDMNDETDEVVGKNTDVEMEEMHGVKSNDIDDDNDDKEDLADTKDDKYNSKDIDSFSMDDDDDSWLANVEDKENKKPLLEQPKLTDPSDFTLDTTEPTLSDEVDGFVDENLDLPEINNEKGELPYTYRLVSVVNHMGLTSVAGHYISDVFDMKKRSWYSFDDTHVTKITEADVKSKRERSGYIFFYMDKQIYDELSLDIAVNKTARKT